MPITPPLRGDREEQVARELPVRWVLEVSKLSHARILRYETCLYAPVEDFTVAGGMWRTMIASRHQQERWGVGLEGQEDTPKQWESNGSLEEGGRPGSSTDLLGFNGYLEVGEGHGGVSNRSEFLECCGFLWGGQSGNNVLNKLERRCFKSNIFLNPNNRMLLYFSLSQQHQSPSCQPSFAGGIGVYLTAVQHFSTLNRNLELVVAQIRAAITGVCSRSLW